MAHRARRGRRVPLPGRRRRPGLGPRGHRRRPGGPTGAAGPGGRPHGRERRGRSGPRSRPAGRGPLRRGLEGERAEPPAAARARRAPAGRLAGLAVARGAARRAGARRGRRGRAGRAGPARRRAPAAVARGGSRRRAGPRPAIVERPGARARHRGGEGAMTIVERIDRDLTEALRTRQAERLSALRMIKTALTLRATEVPGPLGDEDAARVLTTLLKQRRDAAEQYRAAGREDLARKEEAGAAVVQGYLPAAPTEDEVAVAVEAAVVETGAASPRDLGVVMTAARARLAGKTVDGRALAERVKARLSS